MVIEFDAAGFSYGAKTVLRDVTLSLEPGSFHVLTGASGAGKSTFLRLCYLDLAPDRGAIRFYGRPAPRRDRDAVADLRKTMGVVHQDCQFLDHLPLIDNIALPLRVSGLSPAARAEDLQALLEWVDLTDRVAASPSELSSGERQRAALARAVILSPEIVLADEPTGAVDRESALRILTLLVELNRMGKTVLVATHDREFVRAAEAHADARVHHLAGGRVEAARADA